MRELRNAVERIARFGREPSTSDHVLSCGQARGRANCASEQRWLRDLLEASDHHASRAARTARMPRSQLGARVQRCGLSRGAAEDRDDHG